MTMLATHEIQSGNAIAADGRFFNTPPTPSDMYSLSDGILNEYGQILNDGRGVLMTFGEAANDSFGDTENPLPPTPPIRHTLEFDGGNADQGNFAWRYTVADPATGRTVRQMHVSDSFWRVQEFAYDQQGVLRRQDEWSEPTILAESIRQLITGESFKTRAQDLMAKRQQAEAGLASLALSLAERNLSEDRVAKLLKKPSIGVLARSFVACSPIPPAS